MPLKCSCLGFGRMHNKQNILKQQCKVHILILNNKYVYYSIPLNHGNRDELDYDVYINIFDTLCVYR